MPRGDGNGPPAARTQRNGRMRGNQPGGGPIGQCICPKCGEKLPHKRGVPCYSIHCPKCQSVMTRE
jgi:hypothetical protein